MTMISQLKVTITPGTAEVVTSILGMIRNIEWAELYDKRTMVVIFDEPQRDRDIDNFIRVIKLIPEVVDVVVAANVAVYKSRLYLAETINKFFEALKPDPTKTTYDEFAYQTELALRTTQKMRLGLMAGDE